MRKAIILALLGLCISRLDGVMVVDRNYLLNPFVYSIRDGGGFLTQVWGWGEFSRYIARTDLIHFWTSRLGGSAELYRYQNQLSLVIASDIELVSGSNSTIYFEPRAVYWQEYLSMFTALPAGTFSFGFYHRCKHDMDNLNQLIRYGETNARVAIYDSIILGFSFTPLIYRWDTPFGLTTQLKPYLRNHWYVITSDIAYLQTDDYEYEDLKDTLMIGAQIELLRYGQLMLFFNSLMMLDFYVKHESMKVPVDWSLEAGVALLGNAARLELIIRYEKFFETGVEPQRLEGEYWIVGLKLE